MGSTSSVFVAPGGHIWVAERCGANTCAGSSVAPILEFDESGKLLKSFGANLFVFPHSLLMDNEGNLWIADGQGKDGKGHQVFKLSQDGKILMTLGKAGVAGDGPDTFNQPNPSRLRATAPSLFPTVITPGAGMRASSNFPRMERSSSNGEGTDRRRDSLRFRTRWPSTRRGGCLSATAPTTGFRSSTRMANFSKSGSSSAGRAESSSTATT